MTASGANPNMTSVRVIRVVVGLLGVAATLSAGYGASVSYGKAWAFFGFEAVSIFAGLAALVFAMGRIRLAPELALACIAGTLFVSAVLGYVPIRQGLEGLPLKPLWWAATRLGLAGLFAAVAVIMSIAPNSSAVWTLARAIAWAVPLAVVCAWYKFASLAPLTSGQAGVLEVLRVLAVFVVAVASGVSLCAFVHYAIRAFEIAFPETSEA